MRYVILSLCFLLSISAVTPANAYLEGSLKGLQLNYRADEQYLQISLANLKIPKIEDVSVIERIFVNRPDYVLCKISIRASDADKNVVTLIPFSLERQHTGLSNSYKYDAIDPGTEYLLVNSLKFPYDGSLFIQIELLAWQGEENLSLAKSLYSSVNGLEVISPEVMTYIETGLSLIEGIFPPERSNNAVRANLALGVLTQSDYQVTRTDEDGNKTKFLTIRFKTKEANFEGANFTPAEELECLTDQNAWKKVLRESAAQSVAQQNPKLIKETLLGFSDYVATKPLVEKDKALYAAGAIHNWVPESVVGCLEHGCIKGAMFQAMPVGKIEYIRTKSNYDWNIAGVNCENPSCLSLNDFICKSYSVEGREKVKGQIKESFRFYVDNKHIAKITPEEFVSSFEITRINEFKVRSNGPNSLIYIFNKGDTEIFYTPTPDANPIQYNNRTLKIHQILDGDKYFIKMIEMDS